MSMTKRLWDKMRTASKPENDHEDDEYWYERSRAQERPTLAISETIQQPPTHNNNGNQSREQR